eukprot:scaffold4523_cov138-Isochrysis_galbana.AAC.1
MCGARCRGGMMLALVGGRCSLASDSSRPSTPPRSSRPRTSRLSTWGSSAALYIYVATMYDFFVLLLLLLTHTRH